MKAKTHKLKTAFGLISLSAFLSFGYSTFAETYYLWSGASGANNGTSWANAWTSTASAGSTATDDDIVYVGESATGGSYSGFTFANAGSSGHRITFMAAQDTHTGLAVFTSGITASSGKNYITIDGRYNGSRNIRVAGTINFAYSSYPIIRGVEITTTDIGISYQGDTTTLGGEITDCYLHDINEEAGIKCTGRNYNNAGYDAVLISNTIVQVNNFAGTTNGTTFGISGDGSGPDGIQGCWGLTVADCILTNAVGTVNPISVTPSVSYQHQDLFQMEQKYIKLLRTKFLNGSADSCVDFDSFNGNPHHHIITGCTFVMRRGSGIRYYAGGGETLTTMDNIYIVGNTFVDHQSGHQFAFHINNLGGTELAVSNMKVQNNIFVNCDTPIFVVTNSAVAADFGIDYNLINAGANGDTTVTVDGSSYTQAHPRTSLPSFVSYNPPYENSNLRLASGDTAAKDQGTDVSSIGQGVSLDGDGVTRPQNSVFDIGAYEFVVSGGGGDTGNTVTIGTLTIGPR